MQMYSQGEVHSCCPHVKRTAADLVVLLRVDLPARFPSCPSDSLYGRNIDTMVLRLTHTGVPGKPFAYSTA
jgi:hypothetical protein